MGRIATLLVIITAAFSGAAASKEVPPAILAHFENGEIALVISGLLRSKAEDPEAFAAGDHEYLLARAYERNGEPSHAVASYVLVAGSDSLLGEYALWRLSQIARSSGNLFLERLYLHELQLRYPDSLLLTASNARIARSLSEGRNYSFAIPVPGEYAVVPGEKRSGKKALVRGDLAVLANAYLHSGDHGKARELLERLVSESPDPQQPDDLALEGVKGLDSLDGKGSGRGAVSLDPEERYRRANVYQFNRNFAEARAHYLAIVHQHPDHPLVPDAAFRIGRAYVQLQQYAEAIPWFERVLEQFPNVPVAKDALLQAGSAYTRFGKHREAISRFRRYIDRYPDDDRLDRAYLNIIDVARDSDQETAALRQAAETREAFRGKTAEAQAYFAEARIYIAGEKWEPALAALNKLAALPDLGGNRVPGGSSKAEVTFLTAFVLENLQRYSEAVENYLDVPDGRNDFYGWMSNERLIRMSANPAATEAIEAKRRKLLSASVASSIDERRAAIQKLLRITADGEARGRMLDSLREIYSSSRGYSKVPGLGGPKADDDSDRTGRPTPRGNEKRHAAVAEALSSLGLYDEAAPELEASGIPKGEPEQQALAALYTKGGFAYRGVEFLEPRWQGVPADFQIELIPREVVALLYPAPYGGELLASAAPRNVDPRLLLAIMRQESRYRSDAKSNAAARGLMQFIPQTSAEIARSVGLGDFRQDDLYDPATAILLGSQYVADLLRAFPNQLPAAAAGYNAGEDSIRRWKNRSKSDLPERYVPEIAYAQTKDYVHKVMANYRVYTTFYTYSLERIDW